MQNYLNQLALRIQQPELGVQPRPLSRFESPHYSIFESSEPSESFVPMTAEASGEPESLSDQFISARVSADKSPQLTESRGLNKSQTVDSMTETSSATESHQPYSWKEVDQITIGEQPMAQNGRTPRAAEEPIKPVVQVEKPEEIKTSSLYKPSSERRELSEPTERAIQGEREQMTPSAEIKKPLDTSSVVTADLSARQQFAEKKASCVQIEKEHIRPLLNIENPEQKKASNSAHTVSSRGEMLGGAESSEVQPLFERRSDLMPKSNFSSAQRREIFKLFAESTALQHATEQSADETLPTIQVTIGRIEVRATVAATPARKTPAKSSAMSLDDYLKQRQSGVRS
ncbi:hypothetical protein [Nitrosomonas sp. Nm166]|uniref:hypothetical protein n=1 Tax=Nitrosomonas sp. Nm166 TaxID=1881054 RepID=UPI0008EF354D|nr:hypothetical protein [Nitrosomonas sp. Nm166]SFE85569.1 hypothetical protein SAMN05428977_103314 [Nitrosomonas sp. Nm166]